jgi:nondiscriminating glutamyl-tRNA synthetase
VVDDSAMEISHVIRGEDHLANTLRQVLLYQALGLPLPEFAHLSLILGEDRAKLKKREGREGTYVDEYRTQGWLPAALVNFLSLLGWSPASGEEIMSSERLCAQFDLDRISRSPAIFDTRKLRWMGGEYLRAAPPAELAQAALPFLQAEGIAADARQAERWVLAFRDGLACLAELPPQVRALLEPGPAEEEAAVALRTPEARRLLSLVATRLASRMAENGEPDGMAFKALLAACGKEVGAKGRELFMPARAALSGRVHGPELPLVFDALGATRSLERLRVAAAGAADEAN